MVEDYKVFLAELENELAEINAVSVAEKVAERMANIQVQIEAEEMDKKSKAIDDKQLEISITKKLIERLEVENAEEVAVEETV